MIIKILFFLIPLGFAVAMPLWIARCRQRGTHRWILPWLTTLLPLGAVLLLHALNLMVGLGNAVTVSLTVMAVLGTAAFTGGALFLIAPVLLGIASETSLRGRMTDANAPKRRKEERHHDEDNDSPWSHQNSPRTKYGVYDHNNCYGAFSDDY